MARRKDLWNPETLYQEEAHALNSLPAIPKRHLGRLQRLIRLMMQRGRWYTQESLAGYAQGDATAVAVKAAEIRGRINGLAELEAAITNVLNDEFEPVSEEPEVTVSGRSWDDETEEVYRDEFFGE